MLIGQKRKNASQKVGLKIISMFLCKILDIIKASPLSSPPLRDPLSLFQPPAPSSVVLLLKNVAIEMQTRTFSLHPPLQKIGSHLDALQQQWSQLCSPGRVQGYKTLPEAQRTQGIESITQMIPHGK